MNKYKIEIIIALIVAIALIGVGLINLVGASGKKVERWWNLTKAVKLGE